jgi:hypothetical protein
MDVDNNNNIVMTATLLLLEYILILSVPLISAEPVMPYV